MLQATLVITGNCGAKSHGPGDCKCLGSWEVSRFTIYGNTAADMAKQRQDTELDWNRNYQELDDYYTVELLD